jgi:thiol:disulfide interchange protein DsbD
LQAGKPVFVDYTAAWCITCQVNKRTTLNQYDVQKAFASRQVVLLRADWTRQDPAITASLSQFGRSGVPVYVLHRPGQTSLLLSELLSPGAVLDALSTLTP